MIKRKCTCCQITPLKAPYDQHRQKRSSSSYKSATHLFTPTPDRPPNYSITKTNIERNLAHPCRHPDKHLKRAPSLMRKKIILCNFGSISFFRRPCEDAASCPTQKQCRPKHRRRYICKMRSKSNHHQGTETLCTQVSISSCRAVTGSKNFGEG
jgi:hypothetical protein